MCNQDAKCNFNSTNETYVGGGLVLKCFRIRVRLNIHSSSQAWYLAKLNLHIWGFLRCELVES